MSTISLNNRDDVKHLFKSVAVVLNYATKFHVSTPELEKGKKLFSSLNNGMSAINLVKNVPHLVRLIQQEPKKLPVALKLCEMVNQVSDIMRLFEDRGYKIPPSLRKVYYVAAAALVFSSTYQTFEILKKAQALNSALAISDSVKSVSRAAIGVAFWRLLQGQPMNSKHFAMLQLIEESPWWFNKGYHAYYQS